MSNEDFRFGYTVCDIMWSSGGFRTGSTITLRVQRSQTSHTSARLTVTITGTLTTVESAGEDGSQFALHVYRDANDSVEATGYVSWRDRRGSLSANKTL